VDITSYPVVESSPLEPGKQGEVLHASLSKCRGGSIGQRGLVFNGAKPGRMKIAMHDA
jgi:hypothetical protein